MGAVRRRRRPDRCSRSPADRRERRPARTEGAHRERPGSHAGGGLSVADLIAKVGAPTAPAQPSPHQPMRPTSRRAGRGCRPSRGRAGHARRPAGHPGHRDPGLLAEVVSELPDLEVANYPNGHGPNRTDADADATPTRPRRPQAETAQTGPADVCWPARSLAAVFAVLALALTGGAWQWSTSKNSPPQHDQRARPALERHPSTPMASTATKTS